MATDTQTTPPSTAPARMIAVWCPDWPVVAATIRSADPNRVGSDAGANTTTAEPVAVITANHVVACSHPARMAGVRRGMRRREAQSRCPDLVVLPRDEISEARAFEPVVSAIESIAPGVEITRPGLAAIGAHGPTRYFGGETAVLHALSRRLGEVSADVLIGAADGSFAAEQAARRGIMVPAGHSADFLAGLPIDTVEAAELVDLLRRLGIRTLGAFADLPARDVLARFGPAGAWVHRQCGGRDARPIAARSPATEHTVDIVFEPALDRVDAIAFSARTGAERFINGLVTHGLACTCLELIAQSDNGEETVRSWRQNGVLSTVDVLDRIRWQLEGWLNGGTGADHRDGGIPQRGGAQRPTAGVILLRLVAVQCVPIGAHQQSLWSGGGADDERAHRALARVQTLLGHGSVVTAVVEGGREPAQRTRLVPWGDEPVAVRGPEQPWPGRIPAPAPSVLIDPPRPIQVLDAAGHPVTVTPRGAVPAPPSRLGLGSGAPVAITAWAGPWPVDDTWWKAAGYREAGSGDRGSGDRGSGDRGSGETVPLRRRARFQLVDLSGRAYLVTCAIPLVASPDPVGSVFSCGSASDPASPSASVPESGSGPVWTLDALYD